MEYRSQTQWNEVYQDWYLTNQPELLQKRYKRDFKLSHSQFIQLLEMLRPFIQKRETCFRSAIPAAKALGVAIHRLAFGGVVRRMESFLGIGASTSCKYTHIICEVLVHKYYDKYIKILEGQELQTIIDGFKEMTNIPYMWGQLKVLILC